MIEGSVPIVLGPWGPVPINARRVQPKDLSQQSMTMQGKIRFAGRSFLVIRIAIPGIEYVECFSDKATVERFQVCIQTFACNLLLAPENDAMLGCVGMQKNSLPL